MAVDIPESYFALNNSGGETVNLYFADSSLADSVSYSEKAEEDMSYQKIGSEWFWQTPSMGQENIKELIIDEDVEEFVDTHQPALEEYDYHLIISEVYPNPAEDKEEFLEILNTGEEEVNLNGLTLYIGSRKMVIDEDLVLGVNEFVAFFEDELPVRLRNSGQILVLKDQVGKEIVNLEYPKSEKGMSYSLTASGEYIWTFSITPEDENEFVLGTADVAVSPLVIEELPVNSQMEKMYNQVLQTNRFLLSKIASLEEEVLKLNGGLLEISSKLEVPKAEAVTLDLPEEPGENLGLGKLYLMIAFIALVVFVIIIKQFLFKNQKE